MATQIIKSIKTGGDYATWQAACAAIPLDLVAADENWIFEFENTGEFATPATVMYLSSGAVTPRTIVADATRTVTFRPKAGHGFRDHANKLTNPLRYDVANGVGVISGGGSSTDGVFVDIPYAVIEGLQIYGRADSVSVIWPYAAGSEVRLCLISAFNAPQFPVRIHGGAKLINSIVVCTGTSTPWGPVSMHGPGQVIGCTLVNAANNSAGTCGIFNNYGAGTGITLRDNVVAGVSSFVRDYNAQTGGAMWSGGTYSNNAFTSTIPIGSANVENIVAGDQFVNIASSATLDLRVKTGNSLQAGVTDALLGGVDILGQTRASPPTIGAVEYVVAGPSTSLTATLGNTLGEIISKAPPKTEVSANSANLSSSHISGTDSATSVGAVVLSGDFSFFSSGSVSGGTFTSDVLRDNQGAGSIIANKSFVHVTLYDNSTGALVVRKTGISTNGSGVFSFTDAAIIPGATYKVDWEDVDGRLRMPRKVAT